MFQSRDRIICVVDFIRCVKCKLFNRVNGDIRNDGFRFFIGNFNLYVRYAARSVERAGRVISLIQVIQASNYRRCVKANDRNIFVEGLQYQINGYGRSEENDRTACRVL